MTKDQLLELLHDSIPQPERITCVDTHAKDAVKFCWRGMSFTVTTSLDVTESCLHIETGHAILMQALLRECAAQAGLKFTVTKHEKV